MKSPTPTLTAERAGAELERLAEARERGVLWRKWGPYLSERQWGTVREDYSENGDAWNYFSHDQARSRAYRWGEDGLAGFSDDHQRLCFALALWNGKDPILKERLFGLTNSEGNHGEDVKEYYFYLDSTPTHSYMKWLYKYPQEAYPYADLVETNRRRSRNEFEYELLDTGIFDDDRYFDVFVEYAKASPEDILIKITVANRGPEAAVAPRVADTLVSPHVVVQTEEVPNRCSGRWKVGQWHERCRGLAFGIGRAVSLLRRGMRRCSSPRTKPTINVLFGSENQTRYVKDGINDYVVHGRRDAVNPERNGTKAAAHYTITVPAGGKTEIRLRLTDLAPQALKEEPFGSHFNAVLKARQSEADEFYQSITPASASADAASVMRQALSGMLWSKQYYFFDVDKWLEEHGVDPFAAPSRPVRNREWVHMINDQVISMPDKWEYPWYAAWDLAFHTIALAEVDVDFAKEQLELMLRAFYIHPSGQIPAYEWNFGDVNPPVHAWATIFLYRVEQALRGQGDVEFIKRSFGKLLANFTWWVNRKDRFGKNVFEGGFLGLDNIGVFDRSASLPTGGHLEQADGTAWMALFCQNMLDIGVEIAAYDPSYEDLAMKFVEHFLWIGRAMNHVGPDGMWDEEDGFYYDVLRLPDGRATRLKVRSMVGLLPLCATTVIEPWQRERLPRLVAHFTERVRRMPELLQGIHPMGQGHRGYGDRGLLAVVNPERLRRILTRMLDENEFLSPYGIRSLSRYHKDHPYVFNAEGQNSRGELSARRVRQRHVRRQLELARAGLDAGERASPPSAAKFLSVLW